MARLRVLAILTGTLMFALGVYAGSRRARLLPIVDRRHGTLSVCHGTSRPESVDRSLALQAAKGDVDARVGQDGILRRVGNPPADLVRARTRLKCGGVPSGSGVVAAVISERPLSRLSDDAGPNLAFALFILGALGVYAECCRPGLVLPGVAGGILFLLGLSALRNLPIDWMGAALMALAFALFPLGAQFPKAQILGASGTMALVVGAHLLVAGPPAKPGISWTTAIGLGTPFSGVTIYLLRIAARARRNKHETGL